MQSVDVVIPVYNAPELTKRCIDSVVTHLGQSIGTVYIQDDASDTETREMLGSLGYEKIQVYHAVKNQGFGKSVNDAVARSDADLVLVLNSDTEIHENFLPLLCAAFDADPRLAVISPIHDKSANYDRYLRHPGGHIATYRFKGYAFLIRRNIFLEMGGFDLIYGRGYFEDIDLGRRLDHAHPTVQQLARPRPQPQASRRADPKVLEVELPQAGGRAHAREVPDDAQRVAGLESRAHPAREGGGEHAPGERGAQLGAVDAASEQQRALRGRRRPGARG
ncbi:MAG: glycosyltransferase, partial [Pseudomonadota bacterium]